MRDYYHTYPTCPCCHEPFLRGSILKIIDHDEYYEEEILKCSKCNVYFHKYIDFSDFPSTWNLVTNGDEKYDECTPALPLIWKINPNIIEEAYLNWFNANTTGKYLITWPWKEVNFIPLLISDFATQNPDKKIIIITNAYDLSRNDNEIHRPDLISLFRNLFYYRGREQEFTEDIIEERRKFNRSDILIPRDRFYYHVKIKKRSSDEVQLNITSNNYVDAQNCTLRKCKNRLIKKLDLLYGKGSVRAIKWRENGEWEYKRYNREGYFDISIDKRSVFGGNIKFNKSTYWNVITDINKLCRVNKKLSYISLLNDDDMFDFNYEDIQIFFISDSITPNYIFEAINLIDPDMVIFTGSDDFIENKVVFNGEKGRNFINFLNNTQKTLLLFSVKPDSRHFYRIGAEGSFLDKYDVIAHTWDSDAVIEKIIDSKNISSLNTNIGSNFGEIKYQDKLKAEYIIIECLDAIEEIIPKILQLIGDINKVNKFFTNLIKSPLYIYCDNPRINFRRGDINFENILWYLMEIDVETLNETVETFKNCYLKDDNPYNPIMDKIFQLLTDILNIENSVVFIVVNYYDKRGTEQIILDSDFHDYIPDRIKIYDWDELATIDPESDKEFYIISTIRPYSSYELYNSHFKNFIFIGSRQNLEEIEITLDNRLTEKNARPLYIPSSDEDSPELLRDILQGLPNAEKINNIVADLEFEENIILSREKGTIEPVKEPKTHQMKIHAGEEVILVVDGNGNGLFLPLDRAISFINDNNNSIEDIKVIKSELSNLRGKEIIIDDHGFYASYKVIFTKFVVEMGENTLIKTPFYNWNGFKDLIYSASEWMRLLRKTLIKIQEDKKISENEAKDKLSNILVDLDIHASHHNYIKNFWLAEPSIISTSRGMIQIYEIEHPRGINDLIEIYEKINELLPEIELGIDDAGRCYTAAITLQNIRRNFLRGRNIRPEYEYLYEKLYEEINMIIRTSAKYKIESVTTVKLNKEVYPFRILQNYQEYY